MLLDERNPCIEPVHRTEHRAGARTSHGGGVVEHGGDGPVALSGGVGGEEREAARAAGGAEAGVHGGVAVEVRAATQLLLVHLPGPHGGRRRRRRMRLPSGGAGGGGAKAERWEESLYPLGTSS